MLVVGRRLVLGQPALQHGPREHADEPALFEHGHALEGLPIAVIAACVVSRTAASAGS